jgi:uncharacterized protein (DUF983 family)
MAAPPVPTRPALGRMVRRGLLRRCPWCGDRHAYFTRWFSKQPACRKCGAPWRRGDVGFELGAATINTIITFGVIIMSGAVAMIATSPDIPTVKIVVCLVVAAIAIPILIYPVTYTLWQALDLAMRPPQPGEMPSPPVM